MQPELHLSLGCPLPPPTIIGLEQIRQDLRITEPRPAQLPQTFAKTWLAEKRREGYSHFVAYNDLTHEAKLMISEPDSQPPDELTRLANALTQRWIQDMQHQQYRRFFASNPQRKELSVLEMVFI